MQLKEKNKLKKRNHNNIINTRAHSLKRVVLKVRQQQKKKKKETENKRKQ